MAFVVGENVGPYRLLDQLGQGGMATVFKAYHPALDRYVAIKALHPAFTLEPNFLSRFQREAQVVAKLEHSNIVPIFDYAEHEGRPYLVMKFIEGETLKARLSRGPLESLEVLKIVESVGAALSYAHNHGVLHRDIKPSNVLLSDELHPSGIRIYLADFGLARIAQAGESTISSDVMLGTPQYISPEQAMGKSDLDSGTDIYSFGVLLYELVVGRVPFSADTPYSIIHDHIYAPLPLPRKIKPEIPEAVELVLLKALSKDRKDRFPEVADMVEAWKLAVGVTDETRIAAPVSPSSQAETIAASAIAEQPEAVEKDLEGKSAPETQPVLVETVEAVAIPSASKHASRKVWPIVVGILIACCLCATANFIISPRLRTAVRKIVDIRTSPASDVQLTTPVGPSPVSTQATTLPASTLPLPTLSPPGFERTLEAAQQRLTAEPENPQAYFDLATVYWESGMTTEAERAFRMAVEHAGSNPDFYVYAGDAFFNRQSWMMATNMYIKVVNFMTEPAPPELIANLNQSLYLAASAPEIENLLDREQLNRLQPELVELVRARHILFQDDISRAQEMLSSIQGSYPGFREAKLLEAEILVKKGEILLARRKLQELIRDPSVQRWAHQAARFIINNVFR